MYIFKVSCPLSLHLLNIPNCQSVLKFLSLYCKLLYLHDGYTSKFELMNYLFANVLVVCLNSYCIPFSLWSIEMNRINTRQLNLGSSWPESSPPGSTEPGHLDLILHSKLFSIKDGVCFIKKNVQQKFQGIMFGPIYQSCLYYSKGQTS